MGRRGEIVAPAAGKCKGEGLAKGIGTAQHRPHAHSRENSPPPQQIGANGQPLAPWTQPRTREVHRSADVPPRTRKGGQEGGMPHPEFPRAIPLATRLANGSASIA